VSFILVVSLCGFFKVIVHIFKNTFESFAHISNLLLNRLIQPLRDLYHSFPIHLRYARVNYALLGPAPVLLHQVVHILNVFLGLDVGFLRYPRSSLHELGPVSGAAVDDGLKPAQSFLKDFVFFHKSSPLSFDLIFNKCPACFERVEVFF